MQSLYEFLILNELNICRTSLDSRFKHIFLITKSCLPPFVRTKVHPVSWESFLHMRKDFILRFNTFIAVNFSDRKEYLFSKKDTCFWKDLYSNLGINFLNYLLNDCTLFLEQQEDCYIDISLKTFYLPPKKNWSNVEKRDVKSSRSYDQLIQISRSRMLYKNVIKAGQILILPIKNILENVLKQDVGRHVEYELKRTCAIIKLEQLGKTDLTISQIRKLLKNYLSQNDMTVPRETVFSFLCDVLTKFVHCRIFNRRVNFDTFLSNISIIVKSDLDHTVKLGELMDGIIEGNNEVFSNLCAKIVILLVNEVILKIISCCFYVTETIKSKELVFIPINQWIRLEKRALEELISKGHLQKVEVTANKRTNAEFDYNVVSTIRFIPKEDFSKLRPIIRKSEFQKNTEKFAKTCNIFLNQLFTTEKKTITNITSNIHRYWTNFVNKTHAKDHVYYVKTDIKDAFGSILHEVLKEILNKLFDKIRSPYLTLVQYECAGIGQTTMKICEQFSELHPTLPSKIARKRAISKKESLVKIKKYIFYHISHIYVKLKNHRQIYHYVKGLPQGTKLSAALCNLYYNDFDSNYLEDLFNPGDGDILLRLVDDYLFVTKNRDKAAVFFQRITNPASKYGFEVQKDKTRTNLFDGELQTINETVPYVGYLFNLHEKTISLDLTVYEKKQFKSTISFKSTIDLNGFKRRMLNLSAVRVNNILFDASILNKRTLLINLYNVACLLALRFDAIYSKLPEEQTKFKSIFAILKKAVSTLVIKISSRNRFLRRKGVGNLRGVLAHYLIIYTFIVILREKNRYQNYLTKLYAILVNLKKNVSTREHKTIKTIIKRLPFLI